jgi:hypothetical protein
MQLMGIASLHPSYGLHGALLKNEQDVHRFERRAFLSRREA